MTYRVTTLVSLLDGILQEHLHTVTSNKLQILMSPIITASQCEYFGISLLQDKSQKGCMTDLPHNKCNS